jgi:hypothetical protein
MSQASSQSRDLPGSRGETAKQASVPGSQDFLGPLLRALAETLDVREIFARISAEARRVVPH